MPSAWLIDGVDVPAAVGRNLAYVAIGGAPGVVEPGGFKVQPLAVPGGAVRVMPGAASVLNRYPGGGQQSYALYDQVQREVPVPATGSSGSRTDMVIARVYDPEFQTVPADKAPGAVFEVLQSVPASAIASPAAARAYCAGLAYPAEPLAGITQPPSNATVTTGMITSLRELARPRSKRSLLASQVTVAQDLSSTVFVDWPASVQPVVAVPAWATHYSAQAILTGVNAVGGSATGVIRFVLDGAGSPADVQFQAEQAGVVEAMIVAGGPIPLNAGTAGTNRQMKLRGVLQAGPGALRARQGYTSLSIDIEFTEQTV
ncbi:hypothetical protein MHY85_03080 [Cellulomonas sp. ACRRI]|uniref:hypothetical protein n=1 Tax=Cellulomonas sp. ACRRI TaxID=2918188 RepID=UPI001EF17653|nr:hypothetical protein [Cellulomonas sp. ACRRI]MCG7284955.1 hypothetical protein [Cellulomonas sp. ACRRI]